MVCDQCDLQVEIQCDNCVINIGGDFGRLRINDGGRAAAVPRSSKRALLVGINYRGRRRLEGPVNDVRFMKMLLCEKFNFPFDSMLVLTGMLHYCTISSET
jgi:hypothetical protein